MTRYIALILLFFVSLTLNAQTIDNLAAVRTIHIGDMGKSEHAERFRFKLGKELSDRGFIVTESENADATISGVLTISMQEGNSYGYCTALLKNRDGAILWKWEWEGETGQPRLVVNDRSGSHPLALEPFALEPVGNQAIKLARDLEKDYKKAIKKKVLVCPKGHEYAPSAGYKVCPIDGLPISPKK